MAAIGGAIVSWAAGLSAGTIAAGVSAVVGIAGAVASNENARDARADSRRSAAAQKASAEEAKAQQAQQQAEARRTQIREERVRRARILQSAENTGVSESSGAIGATGALATNLSSNLGQMAGAALSGQRQTALLQSAADFNYSAQANQARAGRANQVSQMGFNIFTNQLGGMGKSPAGANVDEIGNLITAKGLGR